MANYSGDQFEQYRLLELIGQGGFADVYEAYDIYLHKRVAVKVLTTRLAPNDQRAFLKEARTMDRLSHPHIVRVIGFNVHGNIPYLVMEYAPYGSLRRRHPHDEKLSLDAILGYLQQLTDALDYLHDRGLVHQDIKPENMLVGKDNKLLLSDFGITVLIQNTSPQVPQERVGTVSYMAPERFTGGAPTPASDVYSLAVVVFEWLTGEALFSGSNSEIIKQHIDVMPSTRRMTLLGIAPSIQRILLTALAKHPGDRYQSAAEFYADLENAKSTLDQQTAIGEKVDRWRRMPCIFLACMLTSILLSTGFYLAGINPTTDMLIFQLSLLVLPILSALICKNWVAVGIAVSISMLTGLIGLLLHFWPGFWCLLPFLLLLSSLLDFLRG